MSGKVTRFSEAQADRLARFYEQAEREILDRLNRALLRANKTEYLAATKKNIEAILQQLRDGSRIWCTDAIPRVYVQGATMADRMITEAGFELKIGAGFGAIHQQAAQVLAENAFQRFEDVEQVIGRQTNDIYRELALENIRGTVVGYDTWKQSASRIREQLVERGVTGFTDRAGRKWNMRSYAEMVARTTTMESHLQGTANRLAEQGHDLVKISNHRGACPLCLPWENRVLSLTGKTPGYPTLAEAKGAGLFHPNCLHAYGLHIDLDKENGDDQVIHKPEEKPTGFRAAATKKEAQEYAKKQFGIDADYSKFHINTANAINEELLRANKTFGDFTTLNTISTFPKGYSTRWKGAYTFQGKAMWLRNVSQGNSLDKMGEIARRSYDTGFWSTPSKMHTVRHELGHAIFAKYKNSSIPADASRVNQIVDLRQKIIEEVFRTKAGTKAYKGVLSEYGMKNVSEFVAESIAEFLDGNPRETAREVVDILLR